MDSMYRSRIPAAKSSGGAPTLDDIVQQRTYQMLVADMQRSAPTATCSTSTAAGGCSQDTLMSSMMQKIVALEAENASLREQLAAAVALTCTPLGARSSTAEAAAAGDSSPSTSGTPAQQPAAGVAAAAVAGEGGSDDSTTTSRACTTTAAAEVEHLRQQCQQAWQLVSDMKRFLADYGLTWVGDDKVTCGNSEPSSDSTLQQPASDPHQPASSQPAASSHSSGSASSSSSSSSSSAKGPPFELEDLAGCIDELNELVHAGEAAVLPVSGPSSSSRSQLQVAEPVPLVVFRDGLQLGAHPMRAYEDATANAVLCDVFEGYFPAVLKGQYPEGVPLQLVDCSSMTMREALAAASKAGSSGSKLRSFHDLGVARPVAHMNQADLLAKLPASIIKDGRVIPVRAAVAGAMGNNSSSSGAEPAAAGAITGITRRPSAVQYTVLSRRSSHANGDDSITACPAGAPGPYRAEEQQRDGQQSSEHAAGTHPSSSGTSSGAVATIQVKSEDGKRAFILKLKFTDTIADVRRCIDKHRAAGGQQQPVVRYEVRSAFPSRVHADDSITLEQAQLVPSATLYMRAG